MNYLLQRRSLKRRLVVQITAMLAALLLSLTLGFAAVLALAAPDARASDPALPPVIARALAWRGDGLTAQSTSALIEISRDDPGFWFVADGGSGPPVIYGPVPREYEALVPLVGRVRQMEIQEPNSAALTASFVRVKVDGRPVAVLFGGRRGDGSIFAAFIGFFAFMYLPVLVVWTVIAAVAIPWIVQRALRGLRETTRMVAAVSIDNFLDRLPVEGVPEEVERLVEAVNLALDRVQDTVRSRQRFLADAAHELRTPIAILQTRLETLAESPTRVALLRDVARLGAIADQLLDIQRFAFLHQPESVDLTRIVEQVAADLAPAAISAGYSLDFVAPAEAPMILGDATSIDRAVTNLIMNAIQHGGGSGVIQVAVLHDGEVQVSDEGPGIPSEVEHLIFEPFYRVRTRGSGAGLGLVLVRRIASLHGGQVTFVRQPRGFEIRLSLGGRTA